MFGGASIRQHTGYVRTLCQTIRDPTSVRPDLHIVVGGMFIERGNDGVKGGVRAQGAAGGDVAAACWAVVVAFAKVLLNARAAEAVQAGGGRGIATQVETENKR